MAEKFPGTEMEVSPFGIQALTHIPLTSGVLSRICRGEEVPEPVLQVLGLYVTESGVFHLLLSDGEYSFFFLATHLIHEKALSQYTIIKVKKYERKQMAREGKWVVIVRDLEVLQTGETVGKMIGNPSGGIQVQKIKIYSHFYF